MLKGYKTYVTCGLAVLTTAAQFATGDITGAGAIQAVFGAVMVAFLRHGLEGRTGPV